MSKRYGDAWRTRRDRSSDRAREPGPVDLRRYELNPAWTGIPTFMQTPMCLTPEDLRAAAADVAVLGAPMDCGGGQRGAALGPRAIRSAERYLPAPAALMNHLHVRLEPFKVLTVVDYGDAAVDPFSIEASMPTIRELVREVADTGAVPIVLGGDHSILWPDAAACADVYAAGKVGVVHFDAHADCSKAYMGHSVTHGTPIRRLIEDEHIPGRNFVQIGLRGYYPDNELLDWMREQGMRSHFMAEVERYGLDRVVELAVNEALQGPEYLYLSFDIDVLDPAYAPGTGTPEPGGFTTREMFPVIRRLCHEAHVVGFEVVEVAPNLDHGYTTALNANRVVVEAITGLAMRKQKLPGVQYLDSVTAGDEAFPRPRPSFNQPTQEDNG
ncbi:MAG: agmatinase family protein [Candidatus Dormibacteraeota bacterium]|uniref:Agmatinase family protein n=1 Tax=Candidatus Dormiibacter inghamiae TaxID=3127013 RepID=A0A934KD57_9BACT|nr:agmatinase family protein [Candidatus Dormibacteraeota bacterium]MBJ7606471.1 agmatinase family protein [Candidatus Dormibacteraeota bacterium]